MKGKYQNIIAKKEAVYLSMPTGETIFIHSLNDSINISVYANRKKKTIYLSYNGEDGRVNLSDFHMQRRLSK